MPTPTDRSVHPRWTLPPLILHPFSGPSGPDRILESSRANLMLQGILPRDQRSDDELKRNLLDGRYHEIRMLFYVGKDLERWMEQCAEYAGSHPDLSARGITEESFADLLVESPPEGVIEKLRTWGVVNHAALFSRAIGIRSIFTEPPSITLLARTFLVNYYRYADQMYACRLKLAPFAELTSREFHFDLYASREYAQLLEKQWQDSLQ
jgi:hypothetical protein